MPWEKKTLHRGKIEIGKVFIYPTNTISLKYTNPCHSDLIPNAERVLLVEINAHGGNSMNYHGTDLAVLEYSGLGEEGF